MLSLIRTVGKYVQARCTIVKRSHVDAFADGGLDEPVALDRCALEQRRKEGRDSPGNFIHHERVAEVFICFAWKYPLH
jgi:hypothetical protein